MVFYKLTPLLKKSLKKKGLNEKIEASLICQSFDKEIMKIFGNQILKEAKANYFKNKTLVVKVTNSIVASELRLRQQEIIEALNKKFQDKIKKIRFLN